MTTIHKVRSLLVLILSATVVSSCVSDAWNEHFEKTDAAVSSATLATSIKSNPNLSVFEGLLEKSGYDKILGSSASYTVWAPENNALSGLSINTQDTNAVGNFVRNHIARFNFPLSGFNQASNKRILMLSGKIIDYSKTADSLFFGNCKLYSNSKLTSNGSLHTINGFMKYEPNIWEYLSLDSRLSSLWNYWEPLGSTPYGQLNNEDSLYTALIPTNTAWAKAYNVIKDYFKCIPNTGIDSSAAKQKRLTNNAIVSDLIFSGAIQDPSLSDSLISTNHNVLYNAPDLFKDAEKKSTSNGVIYLTDSIRSSKFETWNKPILLEAEQSDLGRTSLNSSINPLNGTNSPYAISSGYYVEVFPLTTADISQVSVTFPIPNTLSTKYKIYCRFVPASIRETKPADQLPCLVNFYLESANSNGLVTSQTLATGIETSGTEIVNVFVKEVTLPYCNIVNSSSEINVRLKVANAAKKTQTTKYTRTMRIDCIILEPVN